MTTQYPDINTGEPWSRMDIADLKGFLPIDNDIAETARFLCRSVEETRAKAIELGLVNRDERR